VNRSPRPASTICAFRDGPAGPEVLMVQRGHTARFMGGAWVFPGGAVDALDSAEPAVSVTASTAPAEMRPWLAAAVRELVEEVQLWITEPPLVLTQPEAFLKDEEVYATAAALGRSFAVDRLAYFANWITPSMVPVRFDTRFFAVHVDGASPPFPDPQELAAAEWVLPGAALERAETGAWVVPFPTARTLERFVGYESTGALMAEIRELDAVPAVQPRMRVGDDGRLEVVLPGEPGFDDLEDAPADAESLEQAARASASDGAHLPELDVDAS
jgi:8-oxo-dGTP pyrophosphatase MutT (NUDIX family)